jgi:hypothetical protein
MNTSVPMPRTLVNAVNFCEERWPQYTFQLSCEMWSVKMSDGTRRQYGKYTGWISLMDPGSPGICIEGSSVENLVTLIAQQLGESTVTGVEDSFFSVPLA